MHERLVAKSGHMLTNCSRLKTRTLGRRTASRGPPTHGHNNGRGRNLQPSLNPCHFQCSPVFGGTAMAVSSGSGELTPPTEAQHIFLKICTCEVFVNKERLLAGTLLISSQKNDCSEIESKSFRVRDRRRSHILSPFHGDNMKEACKDKLNILQCSLLARSLVCFNRQPH